MELLRHTSARALEFDSLLELLRGYAQSPLGRARLEGLAPTRDRVWADQQQRLTEEISDFRRAGGRFEFSGLEDPGNLVEKARIEGTALEATELRDVVAVLDRAQQWREIVRHPPAGLREGFVAVAELSAAIADFAELLRYFAGKILPDGTLDDRASPELARIRREVEKQKRTIQETLRGYLRRLAEGGAVQDEVISIRGERFVIPVKTEQKRKVPGVVHGASSTGLTVYVEPLETIEQNNELVRLVDEELAEVHRILREMTRRIGVRAVEVRAAVDTLAELELQFTKAKFSEAYNCVRPSYAATSLFLTAARHPLLERNLRGKGGAVVPLTLELGGDRQLIISGPNTGGKTVALKTVGLLALMAQAGIPVPAEKAELPVFDAVLADIGDYQSIEQSLSTFSAHVTNIDFISKTATEGSLVLLDELGSATDPNEGAALAVAIAEHFRELGCVSVISTHHTALKVYAANSDGVLNASVGFDEETLQPTYELRVGVPGASAGINIAQRLGLNPKIIEQARARVEQGSQDIAKFLDQLHTELRQATDERARLCKQEQEVAREKSRLALEGKNDVQKLVRAMERKLEDVLRDFEYRARETVREVQDKAAAQKLSKESDRRIAKLRREFKEQFDQTVVAHNTGADRGDQHARPAEVKHVEAGDTVKLKSMGRNALIKRRIDDQTFEVEMGAMKMKVPRSDIAAVVVRASDSPVQAARARGISVQMSSEGSVPTEINVIGQTVDEATQRVEKYVDSAFLAGLARVRIVHGSGMGILRKALRQYLKAHPHVASVTEPPQNEGGAGATVVEFRS
ncbi:MAG: endonuclease MutS2 [Acidobacteriota bacterium]|nr:endonuclease MutS2 [Acidobacteriota bacterium]